MGTSNTKERNAPDKTDHVRSKNLPDQRYNGTDDFPQNLDNNSPYAGGNEDRSIPPTQGEHGATKPVKLETLRARVDKVHVDGLKRTKDDIVTSQITELFKAKNFKDVFLNTLKVREKLLALGCFGKIGVYVDTSHGPDATPDGIEITFVVREFSRITGGISTMAGNNEGSVMGELKTPNLFGRGERFQFEYSHGIKRSNNVNVSFVKPFVNSRMHDVLTANIFGTSQEYPWSGYNQIDKGFLIDFALNPHDTGVVKYNLQYEAAYRKISAAKQASFRVREQCGPSLKSALRHICSIDKRDSPIFPTAGSFVQFTTEIAGLGGDIGFFKNELHMQTNWSPHKYVTFQLGLQTGLLREISNEMKVTIADNFFLGGPLNLRGFEMRGCGPRQDGNSLGGDMYWALALHVYTPLPFRPGRGGFGDLFKLHGFINAGNVSNFPFKLANSYKNWDIFARNVRCAIGGGIAMKLGNTARVELNVTRPLCNARADILQQLQFGIGVHYL